MKRAAVYFGAALLATVFLAGCEKSGEDKLSKIDAKKYVTLGEYKGLEVTINDTTVSDGEVDEAVNSALSAKATKEPVTDRAVQDTDTVNIDYVGKKDGVAFDGGTASGYDLTIGSHTFIDGFEDGLIGAKTGEKRTLNLTFPENYSSEELAGKDVTFDVTVNYISANVVPELNDAVAKELDSTVSSAEEYVQKKRESLEKSKSDAAKSAAFKDLLTQVQQASTIVSGDEIPKWLVEKNTETEKKGFEASLAMYGLDMETYLKQYGMSEDEFDAQVKEYAATEAQQQLLVEALAQAENIKLDADYVKTKLKEDADKYGYENVDDFEKLLSSQGAADSYRISLLSELVEDMLLKNAKVTNPEMVNWK